VRVLVLGRGARESAIARHLARYGHVVTRAAGPSDAADAVADLVVVGPEGLIAEDAGAAWHARGVPVLAPDPSAARLETSKAFARAFAGRHGIPMAPGHVLDPGDDVPALATPGGVVKLDGLAGGKGTWVCHTRDSLLAAVGEARAARPGAPVVVEERLEGQELSVMALCDGGRAVTFPFARDAKRRHDGDQGPNTGGMGAWAPVPVTPSVDAACTAIVARAVAGARAEGMPFRGLLYAGFMVTGADVRLLEFNVRFGDPETQAVLPLVDEDLAPWFVGAAAGALPGASLRVRAGTSCCVVVAAESYPHAAQAWSVRRLPSPDADLCVDRVLDTDGGGVAEGVSPSAPWNGTGGRVVSVTALASSRASARMRVYHALREVRGEGLSWRTDIGAA
jgi:phosphoribosylamine--glycine ligase